MGPVRERERFIEAYLTGFYTITELAERFGMSGQKLHKWLARHNVDGVKGLVDQSRAPPHSLGMQQLGGRANERPADSCSEG
jgi:transposase-like protein